MKKALKILLVLICVLFMHNLPIYAQSLLDVNVDSGFDGKCVLGTVNPIEISFRTYKQGFNGYVEINSEGILYKYNMVLAPDSEKYFKLSMPVTKGNQKLDISCKEKGEVLFHTEKELDILSSDIVPIGVLGKGVPSADNTILKDNPLFTDKEFRYFNISDDFDYTLKELESVPLLIIDNFTIEGFTEENQSILIKYVKQGNTIIIFDNYKILSGVFEGIKRPLKCGKGYVVPIKGNLRDISSNEIKDIFSKYITEIGVDKVVNSKDVTYPIKGINKLYGVLNNQMNLTNRSVLLLFGLICIYLIIIIVSIYFSNKKRILFYVTVITFCILFYGMALWGGLQSHLLSGVSVNIFNQGIKSYSLVNINPYKTGNIAVSLENTAYIKNLNDEPYYYNPIKREIGYIQDNTHKFYMEQEIFSELPKLTLEMGQGDIMQGKIVNPLPDKLYNCILIADDSIIPIGDLDGKETLKIKYKLEHDLKNLSDYKYLSKIYDDGEFSKEYRRIFEYYFKYIDDRSNAKLIGFSDNKAKIKVNGKREKYNQVSINIFNVDIICNNKDVVVNRAVSPIFYRDKEKIEKREYILDGDENLKVYYSVPLDLKIQDIYIDTKSDTGQIELEIYNWKKNIWENISSYSIHKNIYKYLNGRVIALNINGNGRILIPRVTIKGMQGTGDFNE